MSKLWDKGYDLDREIEKYTVGDDYLLDQRLIPADCAGTLAHGTMLASIGILTDEEMTQVRQGLLEVLDAHRAGGFPITSEDEDCHTAIENYLTGAIGEAGKKIHTGRSRNDQVLTALRLYTKASLLGIFQLLKETLEGFYTFAEEWSDCPMPGRTHLQIAMPSSVGLWAAAVGESLIDDAEVLLTAYRLNNRSPLGAAASYGVPLPLNREKTAELLGFDSVQNNVLYVNNSRGKNESIVLDGVEQVMLTLSRFAQDLIIFTLPEFGYFSLPDTLCSGSSIMPQKKNPDALELIRGKAGKVSGWNIQIKNVLRSLPSGYNRDLQETKGPLFASLDTVRGSLLVVKKTLEGLVVNREILEKSMPREIYATDKVYDMVKKGKSFREAYREVGTNLGGVKEEDPAELLKKRSSSGTPGNLNLEVLINSIENLGQYRRTEEEHFNGAMVDLFGEAIHLL